MRRQYADVSTSSLPPRPTLNGIERATSGEHDTHEQMYTNTLNDFAPISSTSRRRLNASNSGENAAVPPFTAAPQATFARSQRSFSHSSASPRNRPVTPNSSSNSASKSRRLHRSAPPAQPAWYQRYFKRLEHSSQRSQILLKRQFRKHGRRIARHPVQTLLLACLIVTSLFYPAVGIYLWSSKGGPGVTRGDTRSVWRSLSTPLLDSFASSGRKHHNSLRDLRMIWDDAPDLRAIDARDAEAWAQLHDRSDTTGEVNPKQCHSIRIEHVFITTQDVNMGLGPRYGSLHGPILRSAYNLQKSIEAAISPDSDARPDGVPACIQDALGDCLVLSPLSFWSMDTGRISADNVPTDTVLKTTLNHTEQGIPLTLSTTLAGRSHLFKQLPRADHLALTFFLEDTDGCKKNSTKGGFNPSHEGWNAMLRDITGRQVSLLESDWKLPKELVLHFIPRHPEESFPTQKVFLIVAYIAMIVWLTRSLFTIRNVYAPIGMVFTACVELAISMTLAISICALVGVRLTLIPWEILPFVIVVIGSENMFSLTNAIISTPASLNVASRMALGFEKVGVSMAITVASDVFLMAAIAFFVDVPAVREFCTFAIFALIVDFILQVSLYATVLSIDLQRLELADLLSQESRETPFADLARANGGGDDESNQSGSGGSDVGSKDILRSGKSLLATSCRAVWRGRTARTASLSLLLAFMSGIYLYHGTGYTSSLSFPLSLSVQENERAAWQPKTLSETVVEEAAETATGHSFDPYSHLTSEDFREAQNNLPWWHTSPSARLWQTINPSDSATLRVKVEPWTVVSLPSATQRVGTKNFASWALFRPRVRAIIWFAKLVVLPIAGTTALLWLLLLYLLKDTELLDAQPSRSTLREEDEEDLLLDDNQADQESAHPRVNLSLSFCGEAHDSDIVLLAQSGAFVVSIGTNGVLHVSRASKKGGGKTSKLVLNALSDTSTLPSVAALSAAADVIALGNADGNITFLSLSHLAPINQTASTNGRAASRALHLKFLSSGSSPAPETLTVLFSFHANGGVWGWTQGESGFAPSNLVQPDARNTVQSVFDVSLASGSTTNVVCCAWHNERFTIYEASSDAPSIHVLFEAQCRGETVKSAVIVSRNVVAIGTARGRVVTYDMRSGRQLSSFDLPESEPIKSLRWVAAQDKASLLIAVSTAKAHILSLALDGADLIDTDGSPSRSSRQSDETTIQSDHRISDTSLSETLRNQDHSFSPNSASKNFNRPRQSPLIPSQSLPDPMAVLQGGRLLNGYGSNGGMSATMEARQQGMELLLSLDCKRGGADVIYTSKGATLVGVRRRLDSRLSIRYSREYQDSLSRWELFALDFKTVDQSGVSFIDNLVAGQYTTFEEFEQQHLALVPLVLEEGRSSYSHEAFGHLTSKQNQAVATPLTGESADSIGGPLSLSFTRLSRVQAFYKHEGAYSAKNKRAILLTFGNIVSVVYVNLDDSP